MLQLRDRAHFREETQKQFLILPGRHGQDFNGDLAAHTAVFGLEDNSHASRPDSVENPIVAKDQSMSRTGFDAARLIFR